MCHPSALQLLVARRRVSVSLILVFNPTASPSFLTVFSQISSHVVDEEHCLL